MHGSNRCCNGCCLLSVTVEYIPDFPMDQIGLIKVARRWGHRHAQGANSPVTVCARGFLRRDGGCGFSKLEVEDVKQRDPLSLASLGF